jgi:HK97 family phage prohead protease
MTRDPERPAEDAGVRSIPMTGWTRGVADALETKFIAFDERAGIGAGGRIEGYASLFGEPDDSGDVVAPGAFSASLEGGPRRVKLLWQHDAAEPIGVWETVEEDERGLRVAGRLLTEVRRGAEAAVLLRAGAIDGLSIGYQTVKAARLPNGGRKLLQVALWEVSLVTFPMLPGARARSASAHGAPEGDAALVEALRSARALFT